MRFVVVGCDGGEIPTSGPGMACEGIVVCLCAVVQLPRTLLGSGNGGVEEFDCPAKEGPDVWEVGNVDTDRGFSEVPELVGSVVYVAEREDFGNNGADNLFQTKLAWILPLDRGNLPRRNPAQR